LLLDDALLNCVVTEVAEGPFGSS